LLREMKRVSDFQVFEVPLDYSIAVDEKVKDFLSYGHINIFTPSLFKFLLKSEGYEILSEKFSCLSPEVIRYLWYNSNEKKKKTFVREMRLKLFPAKRFLLRAILGKRKYEEFTF